MIDKEVTVCFSGHREMKKDFNAEYLYDLISSYIKKGMKNFLCGMAIGFDMLVFKILEQLKVKNDIKIYGAKTRVENNNPTLDCPNTTENYGGYYKLKVGLMSIDEMMYGGYSNNQSVDSNNYLYYFTYSKTLSPYNYNFSTESTQLYMLTSGKAISSNLLGSHNPVINLKSDIQIISGGGSKSNPYVVE